MAISINIDDDIQHRVQALAARQQRAPDLIMLEAIAEYVDREEKREEFQREALASWAAYQETGRHLTGQEVRDWLNNWGTSSETAIPDCHE